MATKENELFDHYWERDCFHSFGALPQSSCHYDFDKYITHETGEIVLSPSPNWFIIDALDCRAEDRLLVAATYKSIIVYHLPEGERLPKVLKVIPNQNEKVLCVRLPPRVCEPDYSDSVASVCEGSRVCLFNLHTGDIIAQHHHHEKLTVNGVCWGNVGGEEVVVSVGGGGLVVVWQPQHEVFQQYTIPQSPELSVVEVNPKDRSHALVAADKDVALINLKNGKVLTWLKGHDYSIYCIRWYTGEAGPFADDLPVNSRAEAMMKGSNRSHKEGKKTESSSTNGSSDTNGDSQYFVTSDYGRNILLWDVSAKRYITKINVPVLASGYKKHMAGKDKMKGKQHIPLAWHNGQLLSSTTQGELLQWTCFPGRAKYNALHHLHNRAIYNLLVLGDLVITSGQDRMLHGFDVAKSAHSFQLPTLGGFATTLAFCPQDVNRLAVGSMDNIIRLLNFGSPVPLQSNTTWQNIKGKILCLSWHPEHEGRLLFGTGSGQVGWTDISSGRVTIFAYYHQKSAYKVEWAPPVCSTKTGVSEAWCAYSFGDKEIVMRLPSSPVADPISLKTLVPDPESKKFPRDITEFSFTPDYKFLAVGLNDGQILLYRSLDLVLMTTVAVVKKAVQHLLWQPETDSGTSYVLAVGSNENKISIFHLESFLKGENPGSIVTQASQVLSGHEARVVWLAWSPHTPAVLASASYDHTVQLWDTNKGTMLGNYGGHVARVFRAEFSPSDPDLVFSCAEENAVHRWRPSQLTCKTPSERNAVLKEYQLKKKEQTAAPSEESTDPLVDSEKKLTPSPGTSSESGSGNISHSESGKKHVFKSFFPKLQGMCSRKKSFHHLLMLNMLALREKQQDSSAPEKEEESKGLEDDLEDLEEDEGMLESKEDPHLTVVNTLEKYDKLLEKDTEMAAPEDFLYVLNMYGQPHQIDSLLAAEIETHEAKGNITQAGLMHCWRGSLCDHIRLAAKQKKLTPFLVASAPQVSMKLWEMACEAYAEQLLAEGDVINGISYLLNIHKIEEAIEVLLQHRHYREALAIAKSRLGYSEGLLEKVVTRWTASATYEGNMDLAATLQLSLGEVEAAARTLSRRIDPSSLFVSATLYKAAGNEDLAQCNGVLALKEATIRQELSKIELFLSRLPKLRWFSVISCVHALLLKLLQQADTGSHYRYLLEDTGRVTTTQNKTSDTSPNGQSPESEANQGEEKAKSVCLVEQVKEEWEIKGFTTDQYPELYQHIVNNFSTQQAPTSVKQLWFLVSISLCECLLAPSSELWDKHLKAALRHAVSWGKPDQLLHLTHALLPRGKTDMVTLISTKPQEGDAASHSSVSILWQLHQHAEVSVLHSHIMSLDGWSKLQDTPTISNTDDHCSEGNDEVLETGASSSDPVIVGTPHVLQSESESPGSRLGEEGVFHLPQTIGDLRNTLSFYLNGMDIDLAVIQDELSVTADLVNPFSLLRKVIQTLEEKGLLNSEDAKSFWSKIAAVCLTPSSLTES